MTSYSDSSFSSSYKVLDKKNEELEKANKKLVKKNKKLEKILEQIRIEVKRMRQSVDEDLVTCSVVRHGSKWE
jgi:prefoldin subunit 5